MGISTLLFLGLYALGLGLTFYNPVYGVATYIFEWHNHPPYWWWGDDLPMLRWSFSVALITLMSVIINKKRLKPLESIEFTPLIWLLLFVVNSYFVSFSHAVLPKDSIALSLDWLKLCVNFFLMVYIIRRPKDYHLVILVLILCVANFGRVAFDVGSNRDLGIMAPNATGGNAVAAHVVTVMPFIGMMFLLASKKWEKAIAVITLPFALNLIILENSRGAFLGLAVLAPLAIIWLKGKLRVQVIAGLIAALLVFFYLAPEEFWNRMSTMEEYEQESSAMSRIYLWQGGVAMMMDNPMGVGGEGFVPLSFQYVPELTSQMLDKGGKTVHNTFLNVGTEWGFIGLFLYLGFIIHIWIITMRIKRDGKSHPDLMYYYYQAITIQMALIGAMVAGFFIDSQMSEVIFWVSAFALIIRNMQKSEIIYLEEEDVEALESFEKP